MKKTLIPESLQVTVIAAVILLLYVVALLFPDNWWGLHYPAFLTNGKGWVIVLLAIGFTLYGQKYSFWEDLSGKNVGGNRWFWIIGLTIISGVFFNQMPIFKDVYGDALSIVDDPEYIIEEFDARNWPIMFSFDFSNLKIGTDTTLAIVVWLSYAREISLLESFQFLGVICGMGYVFFMLASVYRIAKDSQQRLLFTFIVLGSPIVLNFCGHMEIYAPVLFVLAAFWYTLIRFVEKPGWVSGGIVLAMSLLSIKFHITGALTLLIFIIAAVHAYAKSKGKNLDWREFGGVVLGVFFAGGFAVYAFITKSIFATRMYNVDNLTDAIFLPIKAAEPAPYDRYNLFSWNHIYDYFNMSFLWSAIALIVIVVALFFRRKSTNWNNPLVLISGLGFIFYFVVFFVFNPLLGMPTDWDLMSIPAISLMFFAVSIIKSSSSGKEEGRSHTSFLIAPAVGLFLIGLTGAFVNANQEPFANRVIAIGKHSYKTYWIGSITPIRYGIDLKEAEDQYTELSKAVVELEPYSIPGKDIQYAALLNKMGSYYESVELDTLEAHKYYLKSESYDKTLLPNMYDLTRTHLVMGNYNRALAGAENLIYNKYPSDVEALSIGMQVARKIQDKDALMRYSYQVLQVKPDDVKILFDLTVEHFIRGEFDQAQNLVAGLVHYKHPNEVKALRMAIHISLEAEDYRASAEYCKQLLKVKPEDAFIQKVLHLLNTEEDKSKIKSLFRQS